MRTEARTRGEWGRPGTGADARHCRYGPIAGGNSLRNVTKGNAVAGCCGHRIQVAGRPFGSNYNSRTEQAVGNAPDIYTASCDGAFKSSARPVICLAVARNLYFHRPPNGQISC